MKIALISPKSTFLSREHKFSQFWNQSKFIASYRRNWSGIGPGLLIIAALTPPSYQVDIIDENYEQINFLDDYDLVGITAMTQQATRAYQIADKFIKNGVTVVLGGIHVTVLPEEAKKHANSVVIGEAEYVWPKLLHDFKKKQLRPFYKSEKTVDLRDSPLPRYDLIKSKSYTNIWVQSSRGCPHDCEFCAASTIYGHKYRSKTVKQVILEVEEIKKYFDNIRINFGDDNLFVNKVYSNDLLNELSSQKIRWSTQSDISIARDDNLLGLIRKSGCILLLIGLESLSHDDLKDIDKQRWKSKQLKNYSSYIRKIQSFGIGVMGSFIIGLDNNDTSTFEQIIDFVIDNNLYDAQISILTPLPGTRLRDRLKKEGRLLPINWENHTLFNVNFVHPRLSKEELENGLLKIYKSINNEEVLRRKLHYFKEVNKDLIRKQADKELLSE